MKTIELNGNHVPAQHVYGDVWQVTETGRRYHVRDGVAVGEPLRYRPINGWAEQYEHDQIRYTF